MDPKLKMLCELYDRSDESVDADTLLKVCFFKDLKDVLEFLSNKQRVWFAYLCAKSVSHLCDYNKKRIKNCLKLTRQWLNYDNITANELFAATNDVFNNQCYASNSVAYACSSAANAVDGFTYDILICYSIKYSIAAVENKQKQKFKNLGFLVKVIRDGPQIKNAV